MKVPHVAKVRAVLYVWAIALISFGSPPLGAADERPWPVLTGKIETNAAFGALPAQIKASENRYEDASNIELTLDINLSSLQERLGPQLVLPRDNCRSFSAENVVASGETAVLTVEGEKLKLEVKGTFSLWDCRENPIPNSKIEWQTKNVGLGIKTKVPVVITWPGSFLKNKVLEQPFTASSLFTLRLGSAGTIQVSAHESMDSLKGRKTLEEALNRSTSSFATLLEKISTTESLLKVLPVESRELKLAVKSAAFSVKDSAPNASLIFEAKLPTKQADILWQQWLAVPSTE